MNHAGILNSTETDICYLIGGYLIKTKKNYNIIDQAWMLDKLEKWFDHKISRSTLCESLKQLVRDGMLQRITRHRRNPETGQFEPRPTLYVMTLKLRIFFLKIAARMRSMGWMNYISVAKRPAVEAKRAIQAAREAVSPISGEEARRTFYEKYYPQGLKT